ncbi:M23 family metallopeptidase [Actinomyces sp. 186855]|nr:MULTISPECIES: M23 family metallopeptidase [unclassified Actinomyces]MCL3778443.1 M23 family metallopeptidase [Actinomyces sp. AC-20-1]MCL3790751.1 M23 family metallopeptidase [Actinomyces sp. 187325]MCL3793027.1 M23 family metallopeptidase [Actinomyces sp. 186855]MCL3794572.1 M23 family metallopeptidase [Actinomyces sp. 217892]
MTRRERREAERAAARAGAARSHADGASRVPAPPRAPAGTSAGTVPVAAEVHRRHRSRPHRRESAPMGTVGRAAVLAVLAAVTVLAPLSDHLGAPAAVGVTSAVTAGEDGAAGSAPATAAATSVAAAVLGSDADVDSTTDAPLSNVPDAATLARIREARQNAAVTCAPQRSGASGDTTAFNTAPELFNPMVAGTYTVSSEYGYRIHPTLGYLKLHAGQDYSASVGTPIYAVAAGTVTTAGMVGSTGTVTIRHEIDGEVWYTSYLHMYADGIYVEKGDTVTAGQLIAGVGSTGYSTGPHLHFEVRTADDSSDESTVNPAAWLVEHHAIDLTTDCS